MIKHAAFFALEVYILTYIIATIIAFIIKGMLAFSATTKKKEVVPAAAAAAAPTSAKQADAPAETPKAKE